MLRGPAEDDHVLYASHTLWRSHEDFEAWTRSEAFRAAHANAGQSRREGLYLGPPEFEGFEVIQTVSSSTRRDTITTGDRAMRTLKAGLLALGLLGAPLATLAAQTTSSEVTVDTGNVILLGAVSAGKRLSP